MDSAIAHDFSLNSMLNSSHDDYDNFTSMPDNDDHFTELSASPPPLSNHYIDEFTGTLNKRKTTSLLEAKNAKIWKEMPHDSPYHPPKPPGGHRSNTVVVKNLTEEEEEESETEPFDYSIFLNKPSSPAKDEEVVLVREEEEVVFVKEDRKEDQVASKEDAKEDLDPVKEEHEHEEVVTVKQTVSNDQKVSELLSESRVFFGNVCHEPAKGEDRLFHCEFCSSKFNRRANYKRHRLIHFVKSKQVPYRYQCEECSRNFLQRCDLVRHRHVHSNTHPYKCLVCGKGYLRKKDLEIHTGFHLGEKKHKCSQCSKSFFSNGDLCRHVRTSHCNEEKLRCGHCDRSFSRESTLLQHMQKKHKEMILSAFKNQVCKIQQMPTIVKIDMVPLKVTTMTSQFTPLAVTSTTVASMPATLTSTSGVNLTLGNDVSSVLPGGRSGVTLTSEPVMTLPVRVDDVTSLEARTESVFS